MTSVPSMKPVSQTSAMRPSMMTLVSRTLKLFLALALAGEDAAQRGEVQQVAFVGPQHQSDIAQEAVADAT